MCASLLPWIQTAFLSCQAADVESIAKVQNTDDMLSSVLMGDLVMLGLAPLFIYAALKTIGSSEEVHAKI